MLKNKLRHTTFLRLNLSKKKNPFKSGSSALEVFRSPPPTGTRGETFMGGKGRSKTMKVFAWAVAKAIALFGNG